MRISMHPDQFTLINSKDRRIFTRSVKELLYHAQVLDLLGLDLTAKIQIHVGGAYGNKELSIRRFIRRYLKLPESVRRRLVIENDERLFNVPDCLRIYRRLKVPVVFDTLHFACHNRGERLEDAFAETCRTWAKQDGAPIVDYSSQDPQKKTGSHAPVITLPHLRGFLKQVKERDFDMMCEIKDKEASALRAIRVARSMRLIA